MGTSDDTRRRWRTYRSNGRQEDGPFETIMHVIENPRLGGEPLKMAMLP